jgi:hypothetical protein
MMTKLIDRFLFVATVGSLLVVLVLASCAPPEMPVSNNPNDPYSPRYIMDIPVIGSISETGSRQIRFELYYIDPYAVSIFVERRDGPNGVFSIVGILPPTQKTFSENVPESLQTLFWYRVRQRAPGGAQSQYSALQTVYLP